jgi:4-hydroxybenzoate polyprenyltransferase
MPILKTLTKFIYIARPRFLSYLFGPFLVGYIAGAPSYLSVLNLEFFYSLFYFILPANVLLYGVNDIFDRATDSLNVAKKGKYENLLRDDQLKLYIYGVIASLFLAVPLLFFLNTESQIILGLFLLLSIFYSAPPLRFKARPFFDFLSNVLYVLPGVLAYTHASSGNLPDTGIFIAAWAWASAMHLFSAIPDIEADKKAGIMTSAVFLGFKKSLILCCVLWLVTTINMLSYSPFYILSVLYPAIVFGVYKDYLNIQKTYWSFPYINLGLGFILFWYVVFSK